MTNLDFLIVRALSRARANGTPPPGRALSHQREDLQARLELRCRVQELIERLDRARQHRREDAAIERPVVDEAFERLESRKTHGEIVALRLVAEHADERAVERGPHLIFHLIRARSVQRRAERVSAAAAVDVSRRVREREPTPRPPSSRSAIGVDVEARAAAHRCAAARS